MKYWQHLGEIDDNNEQDDEDKLYQDQPDADAHMRFIQGNARVNDQMMEQNRVDKKQKRVQFIEESLESSIYDDRNQGGSPNNENDANDHDDDYYAEV